MVVPQASAGGRGLAPAPRDTWAPCVLQGAVSPPAEGLILPCVVRLLEAMVPEAQRPRPFLWLPQRVVSVVVAAAWSQDGESASSCHLHSRQSGGKEVARREGWFLY